MTNEERARKEKEAREESYENQMIEQLAAVARGFNPLTGQRVSPQEMSDAQTRYHQIKNAVEQRRLARDKLNADLSVEANRVQAQKELEHRRLDIEEEKVRIQKAEVVVKALEVAVKGGAEPQALLEAIRTLSQTMLPMHETVLTAPQIEKKD